MREGNRGGNWPLFFACTSTKVEAYDPVLIAHAYGRHIAIHVIFALNDLL